MRSQNSSSINGEYWNDQLDYFELFEEYLNEGLAFKNVNHVRLKLSRATAAIWGQRHAYFLSHIKYWSSVWESATVMKLKPAVITKHKVVKIIHKFTFWTSLVNLYCQCNILDIVSMKDCQNAIFLYKSPSDYTLRNIYNYFTKLEQTAKRNMHGTADVYTKSLGLIVTKRSYVVLAPVIWKNFLIDSMKWRSYPTIQRWPDTGHFTTSDSETWSQSQDSNFSSTIFCLLPMPTMCVVSCSIASSFNPSFSFLISDFTFIFHFFHHPSFSSVD